MSCIYGIIYIIIFIYALLTEKILNKLLLLNQLCQHLSDFDTHEFNLFLFKIFVIFIGKSFIHLFLNFALKFLKYSFF